MHEHMIFHSAQGSKGSCGEVHKLRCRNEKQGAVLKIACVCYHVRGRASSGTASKGMPRPQPSGKG